MNVKEALKRLKQETIPATYNPDFDKNACIDIIESVLEILKKKDVDVYALRRCETVRRYNTVVAIDGYQLLTEYDFDLLKRWLEND